MTFTTTKLVQNRVLVSGEDSLGTSGKQVLDATQYNELFAADQLADARAAFDAEVEAFYAPIADAVDAYNAAVEAQAEENDFELVVQEAVEPTFGTPEVRVRLTQDTAILRILEQGRADRLIWVGDKLEIVAVNVTDLELEEEDPEDEPELVDEVVNVSEPTA